MLILLDQRMPEEAKARLSAYGELIEFATHGITYEAISGHPDIFFCPTPSGLIVAPNLPEKYSDILNAHSIPFTKGQFTVGAAYPETARYNSLLTENYIIHNPNLSDPILLQANRHLVSINVRQGYVRCNLIALPDGSFITSDHGIQKSLVKHHSEVLYVDSSEIMLSGFEHGFFGGACGINGNILFICGSLKYMKEKAEIESFTAKSGVQIVELMDTKAVDVGTIIFLPN